DVQNHSLVPTCEACNLTGTKAWTPPSVSLPAHSASELGQNTQRGQAASYAWITSN
ncbi:hypothetical protein KUCAC02_033710, partial [Chaenocephalus aceratus]